MIAPFSKFYSKTWIGFCLNNGKRFFLEFSLYSQQKDHIFLKNSTRDFQNSPPFDRWACFYVTITGNFEHFQYFNLETDFHENINLFQKTGAPSFS